MKLQDTLDEMKPVFVNLETEYADKQLYYEQEKKITVGKCLPYLTNKPSIFLFSTNFQLYSFEIIELKISHRISKLWFEWKNLIKI